MLVATATLALAGAAPAAGQDAIFSAAGNGLAGSTGNGSLATLAAVNYPRGLTAMPDDGFLVTEAFGNRVRRVTPDGRIAAFAGSGTSGFSGDGGLATKAKLKQPHGTVALPGGGVLIADTNNFRIRKVSPTGVITTVAGTGVRAFSGDDGPAKLARISAPRGIAGTADGGYLIADSDNNRIRKVTPGGTISTVAGSGVRGFSGDGGPATAAALSGPYSVSALADGTLYIADTGNHRIRRVGPDGTITTVAGTGAAAYSGDGGPAASAALNLPHAVEALPDGRLLIADMGNHRVREVSADGTISTIAGTGIFGFSGEGASPLDAALFYPKAVIPLGSGVLVADADNHRVRFVGGSPWPTPPEGSGVVFVDGARTYATSPAVTVGVPATGAGQVRLSSSPTTSGGTLVAGSTFAYEDSLAWDLSDPATGGSAADGTRLVYAQWEAGDGIWSPVRMDSIVLDTVGPATSAPLPAFTAGSTLGTTSMPVKLTWSGSDATSGVAGYQLQTSVDGAPATSTSLTAVSSTPALAFGRAYEFGVGATDRAGNAGAVATAPPFAVTLRQESAAAIAYEGSWTTSILSGASGGSVRWTADPAASASMSFTGRSLAWVAPLSSTSGPAKVDVDGVEVASVNLRSSSRIARRVVYVVNWPDAGEHTVRIRNAGVTTRIDLDAFVIGA